MDMTPMLALLLLVLAVAGTLFWSYNRLVKLSNLTAEAWSGIDVQLKRRHDLIPNLVETVKGYARHERELFEDIARIRSASLQATTREGIGTTENQLTQALKSLFALAEQYPQLLANQNFLDLQHSLIEIEDHIQMARRYYNGAVREYNIMVESFPSNVVAGLFHFRPIDFFTLETLNERELPTVKL